jgi:hypothetical protein
MRAGSPVEGFALVEAGILAKISPFHITDPVS